MAEEKSPGGEIASGLRSIFDRIGEFFHIFDLSFFVSGVATFGAFAFLYLMMKYPPQFPFEPWVGVVAFIVACYICGLVAFAAGRWLSGSMFRTRTIQRYLPDALKAHELDTDPLIAAYISRGDTGLWKLYIRMWSEIAHEKTTPVVLHHLMRYWAMSATYDSVAVSFIVWAAVLLAAQCSSVVPNPIGSGVGMVGALVCLCAALISFRRGVNYFEYQIEDVVAHFAVARRSLTPRVLSSPPDF